MIYNSSNSEIFVCPHGSSLWNSRDLNNAANYWYYFKLVGYLIYVTHSPLEKPWTQLYVAVMSTDNMDWIDRPAWLIRSLAQISNEQQWTSAFFPTMKKSKWKIRWRWRITLQIFFFPESNISTYSEFSIIRQLLLLPFSKNEKSSLL